jgi:hypothetical protein
MFDDRIEKRERFVGQLLEQAQFNTVFYLIDKNELCGI